MQVETARTPTRDERWLEAAACYGEGHWEPEPVRDADGRFTGKYQERWVATGGHTTLPPTAWWPLKNSLTDDNEAALKACAGCGVQAQCADRVVKAPAGVRVIHAGKVRKGR